MEENESLETFIPWFNALKLGKPTTSDALLTGRRIAEALNKIDSKFFGDDFLERIPDYAADVTAHLKKNNLHKIYKRLSVFYEDKLDTKLSKEWNFDFRNEPEDAVAASVSRLLKLVLSASVLYSQNQAYFINLLLEQSNELQVATMNIVQELRGVGPQTSTKPESNATSAAVLASSSVLPEQLGELKAKLEDLSRENRRLLQQVKELKDERDQLAEQNQALNTDLEGLGGTSNEADNLRKQLRASQTIRENIQDSLYKAEAERDHLKKLYDDTVKENVGLTEKLQTLAPLEEECRRVKDELEECRLRTLEVEKLNAQIEMCKAKLKDYNTQKVEMKVLEEKIATYMQSVIALEDEQRKNGVLKTQIEALRLENNDLNKKLRDESRRADKAEFESKRIDERLKDAEKGRNELREEYRQLNEKFLLQNELPSKASFSSLHEETVEADSPPFSLQQRLLKMEKENELLQAKESESIVLLKEEMNVLAAQKAEVESELNWTQRRVLELEAKLKDTEESFAKGEGLNENRFSEQQTVKERLALTVAQLEAKLEQANKNYEAMTGEKEKLKLDLEIAQRETTAEKEKLRVYMEKARRVIDDVEKQNRAVESGALSRHEFDTIRRERDSFKQMVETLKESFERNRTMQEEEQRLITSHFYNMMMQVQRGNRTDDSTKSDASSTPDKSFLARQRQCCNVTR